MTERRRELRAKPPEVGDRKKCEVRIEEKGRGECSGFYMDYFKCIDHCAHKKLFNSLE